VDVKVNLKTLEVWEINLLRCKDNMDPKIILVKVPSQDEDNKEEINNFKVVIKEEINFKVVIKEEINFKVVIKEEINFKMVFKEINSFKEIIRFKIKVIKTLAVNNSKIKTNMVEEDTIRTNMMEEDTIVIGEDLNDFSLINNIKIQKINQIYIIFF